MKSMLWSILAVAGLSAIGCSSSGSHVYTGNDGIGDVPTPPPATPPPSVPGAKGMALTIGLNSVDPVHYGGWTGDLVACEFDANDMAAIARTNRFEVHTLLTRVATRDAVIGEVRRAATALKSGDIFMVSYSGHGGQIADSNSDETDNKDETWCLYDGELVDDEIHALWTEFQSGVRILVFSDSCHSGTVTRIRDFMADSSKTAVVPAAATPAAPPAAGARTRRPRAMPADVAKRVDASNKEFYTKIQTDAQPKMKVAVKATILLISGCQDNQLSSDGDRNGLFTEALKSVYEENARLNYRQFHSAILERMPSSQSPNYFLIGTPNAAYEQQDIFKV